MRRPVAWHNALAMAADRPTPLTGRIEGACCCRYVGRQRRAGDGLVALQASERPRGVSDAKGHRRHHHVARRLRDRPGADPAHGLGDAPELHAWVSEQDPVDTEILEGATAASGAVVMGRRLFDTVDGPHGWSKDMGYGAQQVGMPPFFVVTHSPPQDVRLERELGMRFTFVSDLETAIDQARAAATNGDVVIMGGGDVIGQAIERGIVDQLRVHLAPMVVGGGTPLFRAGTRQRYRQQDVRPSSNAVHIAYERVTDE